MNTKCNKCGHTAYTSGPHEFFRDDKGKRKIRGSTDSTEEEEKLYGVQGFSGIFYCIHCDKSYDIVTDDYEKPGTGAGSQPKCPYCSTDDLLLEPKPGTPITCPKCKSGKFISKLTPIS